MSFNGVNSVNSPKSFSKRRWGWDGSNVFPALCVLQSWSSARLPECCARGSRPSTATRWRGAPTGTPRPTGPRPPSTRSACGWGASNPSTAPACPAGPTPPCPSPTPTTTGNLMGTMVMTKCLQQYQSFIQNLLFLLLFFSFFFLFVFCFLFFPSSLDPCTVCKVKGLFAVCIVFIV